MRITLIVCFVILSRAWIFSQGWPVSFPKWNGSNQNGLIETYDKGYCFLLGGFNNYTYSIIAKTDINGNVLWYKFIGNGNIGFRIGNFDSTSDGGIIYSSGFNKYDPAGSSDPLIIKFNPCGEVDWCSVINTYGIFDFACRVRQLTDGNYILLTSYSDAIENNRIQLYKLNHEGNLIWKKNYPGNGYVTNEDGNDVLALQDGYLITGTGYADDSIHPGWYGERPYFIKTDSAGNELWRLVYGVTSGFLGRTFFMPSTILSYSGNYYIIGRNSTYCDTPSLIKVLSNGNEGYYQDIIPGACPGGSSAMSLFDDTTFVLYAGGTVNGSTICKWIKIDTLGIERFSKFYTEDWIIHSGYNVVTFDKKIVCLSDYEQNIRLYKLNQQFDFDSTYSHPFTYDSLCSYPIVSDTIDPDCGLIVSVPDHNKNPEVFRLKVYPNPATNEVKIELPSTLLIGKDNPTQYFQWDETTLEIYDLQGKKVLQKSISFNEHSLTLNVSTFPKGFYNFRLQYKGNSVADERVVIR